MAPMMGVVSRALNHRGISTQRQAGRANVVRMFDNEFQAKASVLELGASPSCFGS